jgi:hypothetical protein
LLFTQILKVLYEGKELWWPQTCLQMLLKNDTQIIKNTPLFALSNRQIASLAAPALSFTRLHAAEPLLPAPPYAAVIQSLPFGVKVRFFSFTSAKRCGHGPEKRHISLVRKPLTQTRQPKR